MKRNATINFGSLCFVSIFFSCLAEHVTSVSTESYAPLVGITKPRAIPYRRGSPSVLLDPLIRENRRFLVGGGCYGGPNFPGRYYQTWYNNRYHVPYNFNKRTYFGRRPINIPYNLLHKNQYLFNGVSSFIPQHIEYPFADSRNQIRFDNDVNFFPINYNFDDQYDEVNPFNQRYVFNGDSNLDKRPYNEDENVVFDRTNIINQDGSRNEHAKGVIAIKQPTTVIEEISNSPPEKQDLAENEANVIEKNIISQNVLSKADADVPNDGYTSIVKEDGVIGSELNNEEGGFVSDGIGLQNVIGKKDVSYTYSISPNLTLDSVLDGKLIEKYNNHEISQQTYDGEVNKKYSGGYKGIRYYIVEEPTEDDSKNYQGYRRFYSPFYGGNSAYGGAGGIGASLSSGAAVNGGGFQNGASTYESVSANGAVSVALGSGSNGGISANAGASVSGQIGNGFGGGYSGGNGGYSTAVQGEASVSGGVGVGIGAGFGRGLGIGGAQSFGGGIGIGGTVGFSGESSFSAGSYQVPSQMNYIYRKA